MELTEGLVGRIRKGDWLQVLNVVAITAVFLLTGIRVRNYGRGGSGESFRGFVDKLCVAENFSGALDQGRLLRNKKCQKKDDSILMMSS